MTDIYTTEPLNSEILKIDAGLSPLLTGLTEIAQTLAPIEVCTLRDEAKIKELMFPGIYLIEAPTEGFSGDVETWIRDIRIEWEHIDYKQKYTANFKEKRIRKHPELKTWMPMYLGKSKKVGKRVLEHINLELNKSTFAMKLKVRNDPRLLDWRLSVAKLDVKHYAFIAENLERLLRDRLNPLIGKQ